MEETRSLESSEQWFGRLQLWQLEPQKPGFVGTLEIRRRWLWRVAGWVRSLRLVPVWSRKGGVWLDEGYSRAFSRVRTRVVVLRANMLHVNVFRAESSRRRKVRAIQCPEFKYT